MQSRKATVMPRRRGQAANKYINRLILRPYKFPAPRKKQKQQQLNRNFNGRNVLVIIKFERSNIKDGNIIITTKLLIIVIISRKFIFDTVLPSLAECLNLCFYLCSTVLCIVLRL